MSWPQFSTLKEEHVATEKGGGRSAQGPEVVVRILNPHLAQEDKEFYSRLL